MSIHSPSMTKDEECVHGCRRPDDCIDCLYDENLKLKARLRVLEGEPFEELTKRQRHSNYMLAMRRVFKFLAIAMRLERHWLWMDTDPGDSTPEPEIEEGDIDAYLMANGYNQERIEKGLADIMAIVEHHTGKASND